MSGIAGICKLDGGSIDHPLLERMTQWLAFRSPDAQQVWTEGPVGFGHTLLATSRAFSTEHQPRTREEVSVVADLRLDARSELIAALEAHAWVELAGRVLGEDDDPHTQYAAFEQPVASLPPSLGTRS